MSYALFAIYLCDWVPTDVHVHRIILDASAKRFQAHKIYLQVAAARRWVTNRTEVLRSPKSPDTDARLRHVDEILRQVSNKILLGREGCRILIAPFLARNWRKSRINSFMRTFGRPMCVLGTGWTRILRWRL